MQCSPLNSNGGVQIQQAPIQQTLLLVIPSFSPWKASTKAVISLFLYASPRERKLDPILPCSSVPCVLYRTIHTPELIWRLYAIYQRLCSLGRIFSSHKCPCIKRAQIWPIGKQGNDSTEPTPINMRWLDDIFCISCAFHFGFVIYSLYLSSDYSVHLCTISIRVKRNCTSGSSMIHYKIKNRLQVIIFAIRVGYWKYLS